MSGAKRIARQRGAVKPGHLPVGDHGLGRELVEELQRARSIGGLGAMVAEPADGGRQQHSRAGLVVGDQDVHVRARGVTDALIELGGRWLRRIRRYFVPLIAWPPAHRAGPRAAPVPGIWRRWELNPRPQSRERWRLRVCPALWISPFARHAGGVEKDQPDRMSPRAAQAGVPGALACLLTRPDPGAGSGGQGPSPSVC